MANAGWFKTGTTPNPGGRRGKRFAPFQEACRKKTPAALAMIDAALAPTKYEDGTETVIPTELGLRAAQIVLAYAYGKPPQPQTGEGGAGPVVVEIVRFAEDPAP